MTRGAVRGTRHPRCHHPRSGGCNAQCEPDDVVVDRLVSGDPAALTVARTCELHTAIHYLLGTGMNAHEVARRMHISDRTVYRAKKRF